jgi:hypothetical protein
MITVSGVALGFVAYAAVDWVLSRRKTIPAATIDEDGNWSFPVDTFAQMLAIPVERRGRFIAELPLTLQRIWEMQDKYPLATLPGAVWVDDGKGELRPNIKNAPVGSGDDFSDRPLASGTSGSAQDRNGLDPKGAGPTAEGGDASPAQRGVLT